MTTIGTPPSSPVPWRVTDTDGALLGIVVAQLWAEARAEAAIVFGRCDITVEPLASADDHSGATIATSDDQSGTPSSAVRP